MTRQLVLMRAWLCRHDDAERQVPAGYGIRERQRRRPLAIADDDNLADACMMRRQRAHHHRDGPRKAAEPRAEESERPLDAIELARRSGEMGERQQIECRHRRG